jgi:hypothetical protein
LTFAKAAWSPQAHRSRRGDGARLRAVEGAPFGEEIRSAGVGRVDTGRRRGRRERPSGARRPRRHPVQTPAVHEAARRDGAARAGGARRPHVRGAPHAVRPARAARALDLAPRGRGAGERGGDDARRAAPAHVCHARARRSARRRAAGPGARQDGPRQVLHAAGRPRRRREDRRRLPRVPRRRPAALHRTRGRAQRDQRRARWAHARDDGADPQRRALLHGRLSRPPAGAAGARARRDRRLARAARRDRAGVPQGLRRAARRRGRRRRGPALPVRPRGGGGARRGARGGHAARRARRSRRGGPRPLARRDGRPRGVVQRDDAGSPPAGGRALGAERRARGGGPRAHCRARGHPGAARPHREAVLARQAVGVHRPRDQQPARRDPDVREARLAHARGRAAGRHDAGRAPPQPRARRARGAALLGDRPQPPRSPRRPWT